jgi:hypothetical protein
MKTALEALDALTGNPYQMAEFCKKYHIDSIKGYLKAVLTEKETHVPSN